MLSHAFPPAHSSPWSACSMSAGIRSKSPITAAWQPRRHGFSTAFLFATLASIGCRCSTISWANTWCCRNRPGQFHLDRLGRHRRDPFRLLHAVDVPARLYGEAGHEVRAHIRDMNLREWAAVVPLAVMMVWMGVYSQSFLRRSAKPPPPCSAKLRLTSHSGRASPPRGGEPCPLTPTPAPRPAALPARNAADPGGHPHHGARSPGEAPLFARCSAISLC